jgi:hypothetical protein
MKVIDLLQKKKEIISEIEKLKKLEQDELVNDLKLELIELEVQIKYA